MHHSQPQGTPSEDTLFNETAGIDSLGVIEAKLAQAKEDLAKLLDENDFTDIEEFNEFYQEQELEAQSSIKRKASKRKARIPQQQLEELSTIQSKLEEIEGLKEQLRSLEQSQGPQEIEAQPSAQEQQGEPTWMDWNPPSDYGVTYFLSRRLSEYCPGWISADWEDKSTEVIAMEP